ncbi:MAG: hypothetical protein FWF44_00140 [Defluviitaleaceae bacterium]|nr:hypothetical protein [Defluviitaleaceae bacterium]
MSTKRTTAEKTPTERQALPPQQKAQRTASLILSILWGVLVIPAGLFAAGVALDTFMVSGMSNSAVIMMNVNVALFLLIPAVLIATVVCSVLLRKRNMYFYALIVHLAPVAYAAVVFVTLVISSNIK